MSQNSSPRILVVPASELDRIGRFQGFVSNADDYLLPFFAPGTASFRSRSEMEADPSFKQIIPYVIFRSKDLIFRYTRGKSQGESRLHAKHSIGVGGHVDETDADGDASLDAYERALRRELDEEVVVSSPGTLRRVGLINDDATPVGQVHLGVVHIFEVERPEITAREDGLADSGFVAMETLRNESERLETWSQIALSALFR